MTSKFIERFTPAATHAVQVEHETILQAGDWVLMIEDAASLVVLTNEQFKRLYKPVQESAPEMQQPTQERTAAVPKPPKAPQSAEAKRADPGPKVRQKFLTPNTMNAELLRGIVAYYQHANKGPTIEEIYSFAPKTKSTETRLSLLRNKGMIYFPRVGRGVSPSRRRYVPTAFGLQEDRALENKGSPVPLPKPPPAAAGFCRGNGPSLTM